MQIALLDGRGRRVMDPAIGSAVFEGLPPDVYAVAVELAGAFNHIVVRVTDSDKEISVDPPKLRTAAPIRVRENFDAASARRLDHLVRRLSGSGLAVLVRPGTGIVGSTSRPPALVLSGVGNPAGQHRSKLSGSGAVDLEAGVYSLQTETPAGARAILVPIFSGHVTAVCVLNPEKPQLRSASMLTLPAGAGFSADDAVNDASDAAQDAYRRGLTALPLQLLHALQVRYDPMLLMMALWFHQRESIGDERVKEISERLAGACGGNEMLLRSVTGEGPLLEPSPALDATLERLSSCAAGPTQRHASLNLAAMAPARVVESHWSLWDPERELASDPIASAEPDGPLKPFESDCLEVARRLEERGGANVEAVASELACPWQSVVLAKQRILLLASRRPYEFVEPLSLAGFNPASAHPSRREPWMWGAALWGDAWFGEFAKAFIQSAALASHEAREPAEQLLRIAILGLRREDSRLQCRTASYTSPGRPIDPPEQELVALFERGGAGWWPVLETHTGARRQLVRLACEIPDVSRESLDSVAILSAREFLSQQLDLGDEA